MKRWTSDEATWKTMNRQANLGRSYRDYISHFRLHPRDLKPLLSLLYAARPERPVFSLDQNMSRELEALGPQWSRLFSNGRQAQSSIQISHVRHFSTLARPILPENPSLFQRSHRQYRTGERVRWRFLIGRTAGLFQRREFYLALPPLIWLIDEDLDPLRWH